MEYNRYTKFNIDFFLIFSKANEKDKIKDNERNYKSEGLSDKKRLSVVFIRNF